MRESTLERTGASWMRETGKEFLALLKAGLLPLLCLAGVCTPCHLDAAALYQNETGQASESPNNDSAHNDPVSDSFPKLYNSEPDPTAEPMAANEAAQTFKVPEGFRVNVFAAEPQVQNPIAMTWDARGRLWIAENFTYAERAQRFDLSLQDRVLIFEDADGDGIAESRTVFTDQVQMLTSVEVGHGGVWLMCPDKLLFVPDADGDDVADGPAVTMLDGFEVAKENYHNYANGLKWGPDGWLYGRCGGSCPGRIGAPGTPEDQRIALEGGIWRFHPLSKSFEVLAHGTTNPWGHDWNELGEGFFINTVNGHLWHLIPGAHFHRPFTLDPNPHVYELIDMHADHWHFDTTGDWMKSRDGAANSYGGGHAHSGMSIYLGDKWPSDYRGRLMTLNFHGRRVNQEILERHDSGYIGRHGADTLIAEDPFFRGMDLSYGPDGNMYVLDWSDTGECHEHTGVHRTSGRIFRVAFEGADYEEASLGEGSNFAPAERGNVAQVSLDTSKRAISAAPFDLRKSTSVELAKLLSHPNAWFARQAKLILIERSWNSTEPPANQAVDSEWRTALPQLDRLIAGDNPEHIINAMTTKAAMTYRPNSQNRFSDESSDQAQDSNDQWLRRLLAHENENVRCWAVRLWSDHLPLDDIFGPTYDARSRSESITPRAKELLGPLSALAKTDPSGLVRLTLASTLQRLPVSQRATLARALVSRTEDANDHNLPLLVWYGLIPLAESSPSELVSVATSCNWPTTQRLIARRLAQRIESNPEAVEQLLAHAIESPQAERGNLLTGIGEGLNGWSRAPQPQNWETFVAACEGDSGEAKALARELSVLFGDGRALAEVRAIVLDNDADISLRRTALETLVNSNDDGVAEICLKLLGDARINATAIKGVVRSSDPAVADALIKNYRRFRAPQRPLVIAALVSRPQFANKLLEAIAEGKIAADELTAFDVRQIRSLENVELSARVGQLWGEIRESTAAKREQIESLKSSLTSAVLGEASLGQGRQLFNTSCAKCHRLFGQGEVIGPELTGANRDNLDYLLENIVDPSAVVSKDFRMTVVATVDGQILNGLVAAKTEKTLTLQTQTDLQTIAMDEIEDIKQTALSPMPDGMLDNLSQEQVRDLIAYLMQPSQVPLPSEEGE